MNEYIPIDSRCDDTTICLEDPSDRATIILEFTTDDKVIYSQDIHVNNGLFKSCLLDPSRNFLTYEIKFDNEKTLTITREFICTDIEPYNITLTVTF